MDVTPQELRSSEIKDSWRGYDRDEVDDLLERAAVTIESLTQKLQEAASRPAPSAPQAAPAAAAVATEVPLPSSREDADMLQRTLLLAQRAADDAVNEAQTRARLLLEESEAKAQSLVSDAEATARRIAEGERRRLEAEILDLSARREQLRADADALDAYATGYRERIRAAIEADLENLTGDIEPPASRPEIHDVDLPAARGPVAIADPVAAPVLDPEAEEAVHEVQSDQSAWDPSPDTRAFGAVDEPATSGSAFAAEASASQSPVAAPPRPMSAESAPPAGEWPPPAPAPAPEASASAPPASAAPADSSWLPSEDDWAPGAPAWDAPAPWERDTAAHEPFAPDVPIEANAIDTDSLDDDAFFASLREAVRDDAPLGPRDEDQGSFYESESEQDRRRFRRRR
jgi:DivIVA domain-containing protein